MKTAEEYLNEKAVESGYKNFSNSVDCRSSYVEGVSPAIIIEWMEEYANAKCKEQREEDEKERIKSRNDIPINAEESVKCKSCNDSGYYRNSFGRRFKCSCS